MWARGGPHIAHTMPLLPEEALSALTTSGASLICHSSLEGLSKQQIPVSLNVLASSSSLCKTASVSFSHLHLHLAAEEPQTKQQSALLGGGSGRAWREGARVLSPRFSSGAFGGLCEKGSGWGGCPFPLRPWSPSSPSAVGPPAAVLSLAWGSLPATLPAERGLWPHPVRGNI